MRSDSLFALASLASYVLALPADLSLDRRNLNVGADVEIGDLSIDAGLSVDAGLDLKGLIGAILGGHDSTTTLLAGLSAQAAAALQGGALGCKAGAIHSAARAELAAWLRTGAALELDASIKASLLDWCHGEESAILSVDVCAGLSVLIPTCADIAAKGDLFVTIEGIFTSVEIAADVVLSASAQASLSAFLSGSLGLALDAKVKAALGLCAGGGVIVDLAADVKAALTAWLSSSECSLSASLQIAVEAWLDGRAGGDVIAIGSLPTGGLTAISAGASIGMLVEETGILAASAQASLAAFLEADIAIDLEAHVLAALQACAKGSLAIDIDIEIRTALVAWLTSSSCSLGAELKAVVLFWLSFGLEADVSLNVSTGLIGELTTFITGTVEASLGAVLRGVISVLIHGQSVATLSIDARAQLAAILGGAAGIEIDASIEIILFGWLTGCGQLPGGSTFTSTVAIPSSTGVPSLPSASVTGVPSIPAVPTGSGVPSVSAPGVPSIPTVPAGSGVPSVSAPGVPVPSNASPTGTTSVPTTGAPSVSVPSVPGASETPCDTTTSQTVTPIATNTGAVPAPSGGAPGAPSVTIPSGGAPSVSVPSVPGASETPCDTTTSETVIPIATNTGAVPVPSGGASGAPSGSVPSAPNASSPAGSVVPSKSGSEPVPVATKTEPGAPGITAAPTGVPSKSVTVITVTTTISVSACTY